MSLKVYVDTCVLVAYYDKSDVIRRNAVINCLEAISKNSDKLSLVTSDFTFTEFVKVTQKIKGFDEDNIFQIVSDIVRQKKIGRKYAINIIDAEGSEKDYTFNDFFVGLQDILLDSRPGIADAIHYQIMKNNKVKRILTFDIHDFEKISKLEVIDPKDISEYIKFSMIKSRAKDHKPLRRASNKGGYILPSTNEQYKPKGNVQN
jgi:predicted nucleic acid-binding protein